MNYFKHLHFFFVILGISANLLATEPSTIFLRWLSQRDKQFADEILTKTNEQFRKRYGIFASRFSDKSKGEWTKNFLDIADRVYKEQTGRSISEFCELTNAQMKEGISPSVSRFTDNKSQFSELYSQYLSTNLKLQQAGKSLNVTEANKENWKQHTRVAALESMGGNAGEGALAVNFLADKNGRIVFVGNIQDAPDEIKEQSYKGRLKDGTVRYAIDNNIYQLFLSSQIDPEVKEQLTLDFSAINGAPPQESSEAFDRNCKLALKKLLGR